MELETSAKRFFFKIHFCCLKQMWLISCVVDQKTIKIGQRQSMLADVFFINSRMVWAETTTDGKGVFLTEKLKFEIDKIKWSKTEGEKDEFVVEVSVQQVVFVFCFEINPTIRNGEIEVIENIKTLEKLFVIGVNTVQFASVDVEIILVTPKFVLQKDLSVGSVAFVLHCGVGKVFKQKVWISFCVVFIYFAQIRRFV